jgi:hypothetical protein
LTIDTKGYPVKETALFQVYLKEKLTHPGVFVASLSAITKRQRARLGTNRSMIATGVEEPKRNSTPPLPIQKEETQNITVPCPHSPHKWSSTAGQGAKDPDDEGWTQAGKPLPTLDDSAAQDSSRTQVR